MTRHMPDPAGSAAAAAAAAMARAGHNVYEHPACRANPGLVAWLDQVLAHDRDRRAALDLAHRNLVAARAAADAARMRCDTLARERRERVTARRRAALMFLTVAMVTGYGAAALVRALWP